MKKTLFVMLGLVAVVSMSFTLTAADEPQYKNLKVLPKNTTKQQMDSVMKHFAAALGVKCNYCHQFNQEAKAMDFASDANEHKGIARQMMRMQSKLNKKFFDVKDSKELHADLEVTCFTCHNGKAHPATAAPAQPQQAPPAAPAGSAPRQ